MNIVYIANNRYSYDDGISKKILNQIEIWRKYNNWVSVINLSGESLIDDKKYGILTFRKQHYLLSRFITNNNVLNYIDCLKPDIIYVRYDSWYKTLQEISKKYKIILEINTNQKKEYKILIKKEKSLKALFRYLFVRLGYIFLSKRISGIVAVCEEIISEKYISKIKCKKKVIPNSININNVKIIKNIAVEESNTIRLFFIGTSGQQWHGLDIIESFAKCFINYEFHIVGIEKKSNLKNIFYYGKLKENEYNLIMAKCHICIGTLALYRKGMSYGSPLKLREYLAKGFPVIIGYNDEAFKSKTPAYILQIDPLNIKYSKILDFCEKYKNYIVTHEEVMEYIDSGILEKNKIEFFKNILLNGGVSE